jgi:hypothetical protein
LEEDGTSMPPRDGQPLETQLEWPLATPTGSVIYDQLARIVAEWQGIDARIAQTYSGLLRVLLEDFAREHSNERVLFLAGRLLVSSNGWTWRCTAPNTWVATVSNWSCRPAGHQRLPRPETVLPTPRSREWRPSA